MEFTSYVTPLEAQDYIAVFHPGSTVDQASLVRASYTLDRLYRDRFVGSKTAVAQDHEWPRNGDTTVPDVVKIAVVELAVGEANGTFSSYAVEPGVLSKSVSVGAISETTTYKENTVFQTSQLGVVDTILGAFLLANSALGGVASVRLAKAF
jgi:hypothetical protein